MRRANHPFDVEVNLAHALRARVPIALEERSGDTRAHYRRDRSSEPVKVAVKECRYAEREEDAEKAQRNTQRLRLVGSLVLKDRVAAEGAQREHVECLFGEVELLHLHCWGRGAKMWQRGWCGPHGHQEGGGCDGDCDHADEDMSVTILS